MASSFFAYLRSALSESKGVDSSVRLSLFIVTAVSALVVLTWLGLSVAATVVALCKGTGAIGLLPFAKETTLVITSLFAVAAGAKQWQYGREPDVAETVDTESIEQVASR
jgi:hypothetical protein